MPGGRIAGRALPPALEGGLEDGRDVDRVADRLAHVDVLELRVPHVHPDPVVVEAHALVDREVVVALELADPAEPELREVDLACLERDRDGVVLLDGDEDDLVPQRAEEVGGGAAVVGEALHAHVLLGLPLDELVRARADRARRVLLSTLLDRLLRENEAAEDGQGRRHQRRERLLEDDRPRVRVGRPDLLKRRPVALVRRVDRRLRQPGGALVGELDVLSGQLAVAAVELDTLLQLEGELEAVGRGLERLRQQVHDLPRPWLVRDQTLEDTDADDLFDVPVKKAGRG